MVPRFHINYILYEMIAQNKVSLHTIPQEHKKDIYFGILLPTDGVE